jgi:hypothetical protein
MQAPQGTCVFRIQISKTLDVYVECDADHDFLHDIIYWAKVHAQRRAQFFSLWPFLAWIYESRIANFNQGLAPEQNLQNPTDAGFVCASRLPLKLRKPLSQEE